MYKNLVAALAAAIVFAPPLLPRAAPAGDPLKIGFVYVAPLPTPAGCISTSRAAGPSKCALGDKVRTTYVENVPEGADAERVIRDLARQGHR